MISTPSGSSFCKKRVVSNHLVQGTPILDRLFRNLTCPPSSFQGLLNDRAVKEIGLPVVNMAKGIKRVHEQEPNVQSVAPKRTKNCQLDGPNNRQRSCIGLPDNHDDAATSSLPPSASLPLSIGPAEGDDMSHEMWLYFMSNHQSEEQYHKKLRLRDAVYSIMKGVFPYCGLYMVGSSMSGFGGLHSDLDLCLMLSHRLIDQKKEAPEILGIIHAALRKCNFIKKLTLIKAKVPILKFEDQIANVECDLNVNNWVGIRNTHLLAAYARLDWRLRPLVIYIKYWARFHDINDARKMTISSYSLTLLLIHYLQCGAEPPVMPSLQKLAPSKFNCDTDIRTLTLSDALPNYNCTNNASLGELFLGFLKYYSETFDFDRYAISVRLGMKVPKDMVMGIEIPPRTQWKHICIEEPYDKSNTARSVYDEYTFHRIKRVFNASYQRLRRTRNLSSLFETPF
ncbi:poly(A) RNA polymerase gld-2 homolog A-like [Tubulanus polymorphus]|uniref:poly(A) RNA polymerase gld-2 homolog A-like n=1 Tax=Tubulanus polymorphus TaxID=672921 RepID=UPI003DA311A8